MGNWAVTEVDRPTGVLSVPKAQRSWATMKCQATGHTVVASGYDEVQPSSKSRPQRGRHVDVDLGHDGQQATLVLADLADVVEGVVPGLLDDHQRLGACIVS